MMECRLFLSACLADILNCVNSLGIMEFDNVQDFYHILSLDDGKDDIDRPRFAMRINDRNAAFGSAHALHEFCSILFGDYSDDHFSDRELFLDDNANISSGCKP